VPKVPKVPKVPRVTKVTKVLFLTLGTPNFRHSKFFLIAKLTIITYCIQITLQFLIFATQQAVPSWLSEVEAKESPGNTEHHIS